MAWTLWILAIVAFTGVVAESTYYPSYFYPVEHRGPLPIPKEGISLNDYDLEVIPNDQYDIEDYDSTDISLWDIAWELLPSPITIITKTVTLVFSKALSVVKYFLWKSGWVILGMAIVIGFCAYTPFCTLTLKKPFIRELQAIPYIDEIEDFLGAAYEKYQDMQNYI